MLETLNVITLDR